MKCTKCGGEFEGNFCPWCGEPAGTVPGGGAAAGAPAQPQYGEQPAQTYVPPYAGQNNAAPPYGQPYEQSPAPYGAARAGGRGTGAVAGAPAVDVPGSPRAKSANALGLQWGCFLLFLLLAASAMAFFFLNVFEYSLAGVVAESHSVFGITGLFGGQDAGITEASIFYDYNVYIVLITMLYSIAAFIGVLYLFVCWQSPGNYHRSIRKNILFNASAQAVCSLIAMVLYIVFSNAFFTDMGIAIGSLSVLPLCVLRGERGAVFLRAGAVPRKKYGRAGVSYGVGHERACRFLQTAQGGGRHGQRHPCCGGVAGALSVLSAVFGRAAHLYAAAGIRRAAPVKRNGRHGNGPHAVHRGIRAVRRVCGALDPGERARGDDQGSGRDDSPRVYDGEAKGIVAAMMIAVVVLFAAIYILAIFLPRELDLDGGTSAALFELLLLWIVVVLAGSWLSGLAGARLSPDEAKELRLLKRRGGLGTKGKR